jgi:hypothetical protein
VFRKSAVEKKEMVETFGDQYAAARVDRKSALVDDTSQNIIGDA